MSRPLTHVTPIGRGTSIVVPCDDQVSMTVVADVKAGDLVLRFCQPNERRDDLKEVRVPVEAVRAALAAGGL